MTIADIKEIIKRKDAEKEKDEQRQLTIKQIAEMTKKIEDLKF